MPPHLWVTLGRRDPPPHASTTGASAGRRGGRGLLLVPAVTVFRGPQIIRIWAQVLPTLYWKHQHTARGGEEGKCNGCGAEGNPRARAGGRGADSGAALPLSRHTPVAGLSFPIRGCQRAGGGEERGQRHSPAPSLGAGSGRGAAAGAGGLGWRGRGTLRASQTPAPPAGREARRPRAPRSQPRRAGSRARRLVSLRRTEMSHRSSRPRGGRGECGDAATGTRNNGGK